jgi:hypothetical protein
MLTCPVTLQLQSDASQEQLELLLEMVKQTNHIAGDIVEIGSWKCGTSCLMSIASPCKTVWAFDLFGGLPYGPGVGFENFADTDWKEIQETTAPYKNLQLVRGLHELTVPEFAVKCGPLSLIFLDSDHYSSHRVTLTYLAPLLSPEGMIVFHDWTFSDVQKAVSDALPIDEYEMLNRPEMHHMGVLRKRVPSI